MTWSSGLFLRRALSKQFFHSSKERVHIVVNNLKPGSVGEQLLQEDDELLLIDGKVIGPTVNGDKKKPISCIAQAGNSFEIVIARSEVVRRNTDQFVQQTSIVKVKVPNPYKKLIFGDVFFCDC